jgi:hypothetical protein
VVLGVYLAAWRRWFSLKQQVEELEAGPETARTQSADLGALVADLRIEAPSVGVEPSMGHRRVQFAQGPHGESRSVGLCTWLYVVIIPHSQPSISSPPGTPWLKSAPSQFPDVTLSSSRFSSHSSSFAGVRQLPRGRFGAGHGRCRSEADTAQES